MLTLEARQILGFDYCLQQLKPKSPYGQALKAQLAPFKSGQETELNKELDAIEVLLALLKQPETEGHLLKIRHHLSQMPDWREPLNRVAAGGVLTDIELFGLKQTLLFLTAINTNLKLVPSNLIGHSIPDFPELLALLDPDKNASPAFYLSDSFSPRLAEIRAQIRDRQRKWNRLTEQMQSKAIELIGLKFNPSGEISVSRSDRNLRHRVESSRLFSISRETYTDIYFELKPSAQESAISLELERLEKCESEEAEKVRVTLSNAVRQEAKRLRQALQYLARLDLTLGKAVLAKQWCAIRPLVHPATKPLQLVMVNGRHPKVADDLALLGKEFTPISLVLASGASIITGANMGGKTVTLRTVGLLAALTAYGFFVSAEQFSTSLFSSIGILAGDYRVDLTGLSRFGHEVTSLNELLTYAPTRSLLLIDELASSTNPAEGSALAQAIVEYLHSQPSISLFTTHFDRMSRLKGIAYWQVIGLSQIESADLEGLLSSDSLQELTELMNYRLTRVAADTAPPRDALRVARYLKLPQTLLQRASNLLQRPAQGGDNYEKD